MKRSELFVGVFPGGIMYADMTQIKNGDYEHLALVNGSGITWYKKPSEIPYWVRKSIASTAKAERQEAVQFWNRLSENQKFERTCSAMRDIRQWLLFTSFKGLSVDERLKRLKAINFSVIVEDGDGKRALTVRDFKKAYPGLKLVIDRVDAFTDTLWQHEQNMRYALVKTGGVVYNRFFCPDEDEPVPELSLSSEELRDAILSSGCVTTSGKRRFLQVSDKIKSLEVS